MADGPVSLLQTTHHMFLVLNVNLESHKLTAIVQIAKLSSCREAFRYAQLTSR